MKFADAIANMTVPYRSVSLSCTVTSTTTQRSLAGPCSEEGSLQFGMRKISLTAMLGSPCGRKALMALNGNDVCCSTQAGDVWGQYLAAQSRKKAAAVVGRRQAPVSKRSGAIRNPGKVINILLRGQMMLCISRRPPGRHRELPPMLQGQVCKVFGTT